MKPNLIMTGDELAAGVDLEDAERTGPIKNAVVITFDSEEAMREALRAGVIEFDYMRLSEDS